MSKYINAEDLINELSAGCMPIYTKGISDIPGDDSCIKDYIDNAPAVDVAPVKHGKMTMSEPKLKPCPFCGGEAKTGVSALRQFSDSDYTEFRVYCPKCHIEKHWVVDCSGTFEDAETAMCKAVEGWNTRDSN